MPRRKRITVLPYPDRRRVVLELIEKRPGITTKELATRLELPHVNTVDSVSDLCHIGLIERHADGWHKRTFVYVAPRTRARPSCGPFH